MTTFFCRNQHEGKLWPPPSCHTHPQWYDKLWNLMLYAIHKIRAHPLFHRHAYVSKMPCAVAKLGAHLHMTCMQVGENLIIVIICAVSK